MPQTNSTTLLHIMWYLHNNMEMSENKEDLPSKVSKKKGPDWRNDRIVLQVQIFNERKPITWDLNPYPTVYQSKTVLTMRDISDIITDTTLYTSVNS